MMLRERTQIGIVVDEHGDLEVAPQHSQQVEIVPGGENALQNAIG